MPHFVTIPTDTGEVFLNLDLIPAVKFADEVEDPFAEGDDGKAQIIAPVAKLLGETGGVIYRFEGQDQIALLKGILAEQAALSRRWVDREAAVYRIENESGLPELAGFPLDPAAPMIAGQPGHERPYGPRADCNCAICRGGREALARERKPSDDLRLPFAR